MAKGRGRPRKAGARTKAGRLVQAKDYGNDRCVERTGHFRHANILGGKAEWIDIFDGVGQLHALGMLDGHGIDGKLLREAGRDYTALHHSYWIELMPKSSDWGRAYGGRSVSGKAGLIPKPLKPDLRYQMLDDLLPLGSDERKYTRELLLDHFGLDTVLPLVDRLVNYKFNQWKLPLPEGERDMRTAGADDFQLLGCILRGLFALADGAMPNRWQQDRRAA